MIKRILNLLFPYKPVLCLEGKHYLTKEQFELEVELRKNTCEKCVNEMIDEYRTSL